MKNNIKILCTLGPSSLKTNIIQKLDENGVDVFRINLSHTRQGAIEKTILKIKEATSKPICIDTEGAQIRNGNMRRKRSKFIRGAIVKIHKKEIFEDSSNICLKPDYILNKLQLGDLISIDFDNVLLKVCKKGNLFIEAEVMSEGFVGSNKAVTVDRFIHLPALSPKDRMAINIGIKHGISHFALSFANRREDVIELRKIVGDKSFIISKIESKIGVENIDSILAVSDAVLIDRGDLSREKPIEIIPFIQKEIIQKAEYKKIPVYVATNLLESMVNNVVPTRAEINDIVNTLLDGANGLVLAAETAIGKYPVRCVSMVRKVIGAYRGFSVKTDRRERWIKKQDHSLSLIEPHGGYLVNCMADYEERKKAGFHKQLIVDEMALIDAEQIALGAYSPLTGFMKRNEIESVLDNYKLPNGIVWPLPIVLQVKETQIKKLKRGDEVELMHEGSKDIYGLVYVDDIYHFDFSNTAARWYGTDDIAHPGVKLLKDRGEYFIGGKVKLYKRFNHNFKQFTLTPSQVRNVFEKRGWSSVVGFHTRNVTYRAHEHIRLMTLRQNNIDGLFIYPVIGPKSKYDFRSELIMKSYSLAIEKYYPKDKVLLAAFLTYPRYAGPREVVFTAVYSRNFGCTHFVVGRDYAGVGAYYEPDGARKLLKKVEDIGIKPIYFGETYFCKKSKRDRDVCIHDECDILSI